MVINRAYSYKFIFHYKTSHFNAYLDHWYTWYCTLVLRRSTLTQGAIRLTGDVIQLGIALPDGVFGALVTVSLLLTTDSESYSWTGVGGSSGEFWSISTMALRPDLSVSMSLFSDFISLSAPSSLEWSLFLWNSYTWEPSWDTICYNNH